MATRSSEIVEELHVVFQRDYKEFVRDRKRWKSDFDIATANAINNFNQIENLYDRTTAQNEKSLKALQMIMDAQMI
jgi:hypothetical protein